MTRLIPMIGLVRKDLTLFFSDRRSVLMTFAAPIAIASFFGAVFAGQQNAPTRIAVLLVDQDGSAISKSVVAGAGADKNLSTRLVTRDQAQSAVRRGRARVGVVIPAGFGQAASRAFFGGSERPQLELLYDPSRGAELGMVRGILTEHVMQAVSQSVFGGPDAGRLADETIASLETSDLPPAQREALRDMLSSVRRYYQTDTGAATSTRPPAFTMPYDVREEAVTAATGGRYNGYAHSFAGMGVQFVLFMAIDLGIGVLLERQRGLWKRLRTAPISRFTLLGAKIISGTFIGLSAFAASFAFAIAVFGVRIEGSIVGFVSVMTACALMTSTFGLLIAAIGRTPNATRAVAILATLVMVMLGGAWVPTFIFPAWLQRFTVIMPTRWAVDGFDAMTWRGGGMDAAALPVQVLLGFALAFGVVAVLRFPWEEA